jgi:Domain of unknown function (DUF4136)
MREHVFQGQATLADAKRLLCRALVLIVALGSTGCLAYPDADERLDDEIIYSRHKPEADFGSYKTFSISTEVIVFSEDDGDLEREPLDDASAKQLIDTTVENLKARGYEQVGKDESPDLGVTISVLKGTVTAYYSNYWGYYWGYPYYYYYYPYYTSYSYDTGTVVVDTVDLKNAPPPAPDAGPPDSGAIAGELNVLWTGLVYGVAESKSVNLQDATRGIDQAFKQSPYFKTE